MVDRMHAKIRKSIKNAENVLIISHREPDADTLGAAVALKYICNLWKINSTLACVDKAPESLSFIPFLDEFVDNVNPDLYDLIIVVDAGAYYMTNFHLVHENIFSGDCEVINIDHHASNGNFGTINFVDVDAPSVTCMVYEMFRSWEVCIPETIATALLAGIYGDTGCFMHSNSTLRVFKISSELMQIGANVTTIVKGLFRKSPVSTLKLWGKVFENSSLTDSGVLVSVVRNSDFNSSGTNQKDLSGVVDYLNMVPGSKFSILLNEDLEGNVKGSLRTRKSGVDLSRIAKVFGGGGHPGASGFTVPGNLEAGFDI